MRRVTGVVILSIAIVLLASTVAQAAVPEKILDARRVAERSPAASATYLAWSQDLPSKRFASNSYVRPIGGGPRVRVNRKGTRSYSVGIDGSLVVFSAQSVRGRDGNLHSYDAATQIRDPMPKGVNTRSYEFGPALSGDWLLFGRDNANRVPFSKARTKVVLFNLVTKEHRVLRAAFDRRTFLISDQVSGDWATFEQCDLNRAFQQSNCNVFRYQISTEALVKVPNPGKQQFAAAVSQDGTVYMVRSGGPKMLRCGENTRIVRYPVGGPSVVIAHVTRGVYETFATDETDSSTTLYFAESSCLSNRVGIYAIPDADTAS